MNASESRCPVCAAGTFPIEKQGVVLDFCEAHGDTRMADENWWRPKPMFSVPEFYVRGHDIFDEIERSKEGDKTVISVAFDVGANIGQSTRAIKSAYPGSVVHAFEAVKSTFEHLDRITGRLGGVKLHNIALSNSLGTLRMQNVSGGNSVNNGVARADEPHEIAVSTTGDMFCKENNIAEIDFLKIDTEGHDLQILEGFSGLLNAGKIKFVEVEAGMNTGNKKHVFYGEFTRFFASLKVDYDLFGIYEQVRETAYGSPLRRSNLVFKRRQNARLT